MLTQLIKFYPEIKILTIGADEALIHELRSRGAIVDVKSATDKLIDRAYEYAIVTADADFKQIYHSLENSGNIIVLGGDESTLEKADFRAINTIELSPTQSVTTAMKLHMWGNGQ